MDGMFFDGVGVCFGQDVIAGGGPELGLWVVYLGVVLDIGSDVCCWSVYVFLICWGR